VAGSRKETAFYVVAYDIPDDRRRTKVHKILTGFGQWTQYSLFECFLTPKERLLLQARLERHLKPAEDSVRFYPLCENCLNKVETVGGQPPEEPLSYFV
jgi:CRISPR-associated protein Cas2